MKTKIILSILCLLLSPLTFAENKMICQKEALEEGTPIGIGFYDGSFHGNGVAYDAQLKSSDIRSRQILLDSMTHFLKESETHPADQQTQIAYYRCMINAAQRRINGESYNSILGVNENVDTSFAKKENSSIDDRPNPQLHKDNFNFLVEKSLELPSNIKTISVSKITKCMKVVDVSPMDTQDPSHKKYYYWYSIKNICTQPINAFWCDNDSDHKYSSECNYSNKAWMIGPGDKERTWTTTRTPISNIKPLWIHAAAACPVTYNGKEVLYQNKTGNCWIPSK